MASSSTLLTVMVDNQPGPSVQYTGAHWYHRTGDKESENCFDATASHWRRTAPSGGNVTFTFVGEFQQLFRDSLAHFQYRNSRHVPEYLRWHTT